MNWADAADRLDHLHEDGSTAYAFNFMHPFDANGARTTINAELVRARIAHDSSQ